MIPESPVVVERASGHAARHDQRVLRRPEVQLRTGLSRSSIYAAIARNEFPRQILIGVRSVGWLAADIDDWIERRAAATTTTAAARAPHRRLAHQPT
jgi:prophage regulatory protein